MMETKTTQTIKKTKQSYTRRTLVLVSGLSPQIVTETLYALAVDSEKPWIPTEIHVITTSAGAESARLSLLDSKTGWFYKIIQEYKLPGIQFSEQQIHIIGKNAQLNDIRTPAENSETADCITELIRELTSDKHNQVHASIAGGRKTMGYYLGYSMSLFGRAQDQLSHVLVSEPFESHPDFFYPSKEPTIIHSRDAKPRPLDTSQAKIELANIPFVRMRNGLPDFLLEGKQSFSEAIQLAQQAREEAHIKIVHNHKGINFYCGGQKVEMPPVDTAFYLMMIENVLNDTGAINARTENLVSTFLDVYKKIVNPNSGNYEHVEKALQDDDLKSWFDMRKSRTNKALKKQLGKHFAEKYCIQAVGRRPLTQYMLIIDENNIHFEFE